MEPFKNEFSAAKARLIAERLQLAHPAFPMRRFLNGLDAALDPLELKPRVIHLAERIESCLPGDPRVLFPILVRALAADESDPDGLRGFPVWPLTEIVARRGLGHFRESMAALREMTGRFTAEFAIRPFLREHPEKTLRQLRSWCAHPDHHVRRLVSEGSRPFLPWGGNLPQLCEPPHPTLVLLEKLHDDPSDYVRLSVSNHLNDLAKRHPDLVISTLTRWRTAATPDARFEKLARHACRTLLKQGHPAALRFHGFATAEALEITTLELPRTRLRLGESLAYRMVVRNNGRRPVRVMFDYAIHHRKANGTLSPKVFKGRVREIEPGATWEIVGTHPIRPITTRVYHQGIHRFEPRLNGATHPGLEFSLKLR
jgi:3-methyladenine DNA glycosylase AlkC